jgi:hypothetical protein
MQHFGGSTMNERLSMLAAVPLATRSVVSPQLVEVIWAPINTY